MQKPARTIGILFIVATVASIAGGAVTDSFVNSNTFLTDIAVHANQVLIGALLAFLAGLCSAGIALWLYPIIKQHDPSKAIASVGFTGTTRLRQGA